MDDREPLLSREDIAKKKAQEMSDFIKEQDQYSHMNRADRRAWLRKNKNRGLNG